MSSQAISDHIAKYDSTPHLFARAEFEETLKNYRPSPQALITLRATPFVAMLGLTSSGRNTIIRELVKTGHYHFIITDTTRPPRYNDGVLERNGIEYYFRTEQQMLADIIAGRYIEAEIIHNQQVSGVSVREVERAHQESKIAITDLDIEGAYNIVRLKPHATAIFLLPPTFDEWLQRIQKRTPVKPVELYRRLQTGTRILKAALASDTFVFVVNDDFTRALQTVDEIARFGVHHKNAEQHSRLLAQELYDQTIAYLRVNAPHFPPL